MTRRPDRRLVGLGLAILGLAGAAGAFESEGTRVWAHGDSLKVSPGGRWFNPAVPPSHRTRNAVFDDATRILRIAGARGETLGFQLQIEASRAALSDVDVAVELAGGGRPVAHFERFLAHYTEVREKSTSPGPSTGTGLYPDALIPFRVPGHGAPFSIERGRTQGVWIDAAISRSAAPGVYRGTVLVTARGKAPIRLSLELTVFDFSVPERPSFRINVTTYDVGKGGHAINSGWQNRFDIWGPEYAQLERRFYRMARAHRHVFHPRNVELPVSVDASGALSVDWARFDRRFGPLLDGSAFEDERPISYWEIGLAQNLPADRFGGARTPARGRAVEAYARAFAKHFSEKGWKPDELVAFPADEPSRESAFAEASFLARALRRGAPDIRFRMDVYKALDRELIERFDALVDIWAIQGSYFKGLLGELVKRRERGVQVWFYQGSAPALGPEILDTEGLALRTWGFIGWRYRMDAADLWEGCKWQLTDDIWTNPQNNPWPTNGPGVLYYPGAKIGVDEPIPSIRLKQLRRGSFDHDYLALLAELGDEAGADAVARSVVRSALDDTSQRRGESGDWSHDPDAWEAARMKLARTIEARRGLETR